MMIDCKVVEKFFDDLEWKYGVLREVYLIAVQENL